LSGNPPKSKFSIGSSATFIAELSARIIVFLGIWVVAAYLVIDPWGQIDVSDRFKATFDLAVVILTILLSLIADQILTSVYGKRARDEISESHDLIISAIEGTSQVQTFGNQSAFEQHILHRVASAVEVKNTFVSYKVANGNPNALDEANLECYRRFFASGNEKRILGPRRWTDIVGYNEFFGPRYEELQKILPRDQAQTRHIVRVIRHNMPVLNFTIFYFDSFSDEREVVFGWLHSDIVSSRRLFRSNNSNVIDMFEDFYNLISQYKIQDDVDLDYSSDNIRRKSEMSDRRGWWYCVGLRGSGSSEPVSESVFHIEFLEHGVEIDGEVRWMSKYNDQEPVRESINHKSDKVSYTTTKMFLEYKEPDFGRRGICVYNFATSTKGAVLTGYLQDHNSAERIQLFGVRIREEYTTGPTSETIKVSETNEEALLAAIRKDTATHPHMQRVMACLLKDLG